MGSGRYPTMNADFRRIQTVSPMASISLSFTDHWYVSTSCEFKEDGMRASVVAFAESPQDAVTATLKSMIEHAKEGNLWLRGTRFFWNGENFVKAD